MKSEYVSVIGKFHQIFAKSGESQHSYCCFLLPCLCELFVCVFPRELYFCEVNFLNLLESIRMSVMPQAFANQIIEKLLMKVIYSNIFSI